MIYEKVDPDARIRQGDIFRCIPRIDFSLAKLPIVSDAFTEEASWAELLADGRDEITAIVGMKAVTGIVITQDCDAVRAPQITLCEIRPFQVVEPSAKTAVKPNARVSMITEQSKKNLKWFYLPPDPAFSIAERMAADFRITLSVMREDLEALRPSRLGRLNSVADEHFRERLSEFFRRYPVDEWYALDGEEMQKYSDSHPDAEPFPWQKLA